VSVPQWLCHVNKHALLERGAPPLSTDDELFYEPIVSGLTGILGGTHAVPPPITAEKLMAVWRAVQPNRARDPETWAFWTHVLLAYHWLLRPGEHCGPAAGVRCGDVAFFALAGSGLEGVRCHLGVTKGELRGHSFLGELVRAPAMPGSPLCPVQALREYAAVYGLDARPGQLLFPALGRGGALLSTPMSLDDFNARLAALFSAARVAGTFSARGLRAGRRSDLRNAGTPIDIVCQSGRWKSESASYRYQRADDTIVAAVRLAGAYLV
jgi:integrase